MAVQYELSYASRIGHHCHILWAADLSPREELSVPDIQQARIMTLPVSSFNDAMAPLKYGRFYPAQVVTAPFEPPAGIFRVTGILGSEYTADFNHPLAGKDSVLQTASIHSEIPAVGTPGMILEWAGIESPLTDKDTDFSIPHAFDRTDSSDDAIFYENPRKVLHADKTCVSRITACYGSLISPEDAVLDLMSSWHSHLSEKANAVTGLGMNAAEMADNQQLSAYVVHDLNRHPGLPFNDRSFQAVVNTVSIEYLTEPQQVFNEVRRVLKPGGLVIVTFSNRFFPPKTTRFWARLHPAERLGWVLQLLHTAGFSDLHCRVERGLRRSPDDRYTGQVEEMDPFFAAWGRATGG